MTGYSRNILLTIFLSCTCSFVDKTTPNVEYIVYGIYCGECYGHCATMFKIDNTHLLIDTTDSYFKNQPQGEKVTFTGDSLNREQFQKAIILKSTIPKLLLDSKDRKFGIPDEYDQCGIFIQFKIANKLKTFHIDTNLKEVPAEIRSYAQSIMALSRFRPQ